MIVKGIIFDNNGTLSNIHTDEWYDEVYRVISNLLSYQGITLASNVVRDLYFQLITEPRAASGIRCHRHLPRDYDPTRDGPQTRIAA